MFVPDYTELKCFVFVLEVYGGVVRFGDGHTVP